MLRFVCLLILFVSVVDSAGKSRKKKSIAADVIDQDIDLDAINKIHMELHSLEHWNSLLRETFKLICTDLHMNERGDRVTLARRLHEHFHVHQSLNVENPLNQVSVPTNYINQGYLMPYALYDMWIGNYLVCFWQNFILLTLGSLLAVVHHPIFLIHLLML